MYFISDYKKACKAERLKLKGSGLFLLTLIMAAFIPVIFTIVSLAQSESSITSVNVANPWKELISNCFGGFGSFFFPVFLTLVVIRLAQMEHRSGGWKLIETQPVSKISLYLGKFSMAVVVAFCCILALVIFSLLSGMIIMLAKSGSGFSKSSIPFPFIFDLGFRLLISGLGVLGIQFLFSVAISGFSRAVWNWSCRYHHGVYFNIPRPGLVVALVGSGTNHKQSRWQHHRKIFVVLRMAQYCMDDPGPVVRFSMVSA